MPATEVDAARRAFVQLLREGVQEKARAGGSTSGGAWRTLAWRDAFSTEPFFEAVVGDAPLRVRQQLQGELQGFGTGLTVWPAACVLLKYLEQRVRDDASVSLEAQYVLELGSGTGAVAIAAAMLGARRVVITDVDNVRFLMQANVDMAVEQATARGQALDIRVETYEWGAAPSDAIVNRAGEFPDLILVSDCILPRLYPIEPLVAALDLLATAHTTILISFEHRYYEPFDPKTRFWELMRAKRFALRELATDEYHAHFRADDIEIWEITRR
ncbi:hypothetical protein PybrP1_011703 [[Pythium] brassicae (nom. inval.)]|nr:hypothetical protein PybrP1_011703 [[Pythium] brassicae (nom. inval.)]